MHDIIKMCSFEGTKSTKGASKMRRDLLNAEIGQLRDLLPLPPSTRQRLSQLQLMALVCVYVRKSNYFQQALKNHPLSRTESPNIEFLKALSGFLMMLTQGGKLLYISDNAAEYLGHSMEDLLIHGDSVFDIIDKQDHAAVQAELARGAQSASVTNTPLSEEDRLFLCRMNVSRNARRQMRFGDQKVVLVQGHYLSYLPLCSRNEPVFLAHCTPVAMPETRECVVQGATNVFTTIHTLDMKFISLDRNGEFYLGYSPAYLAGVSWYHLIHPDNLREAQTKHRLITSSEQDRSCILLLRLQAAGGSWIWIHCVLQVKDSPEGTQQPAQQGHQTTPQQSHSQQPVIVATNQVLSEREASVLRANSWLYHYYTMQSKLQYGLAYDAHSQRVHPYYPQVMTYQPDATTTSYITPSALTGSPYGQPYSSPHPSATGYPLATSSPYFQHYHHHYSMRLHHSLEYTRDGSWGYYDTAPPTSAQHPSQPQSHTYQHSSHSISSGPASSVQASTKSQRRSPPSSSTSPRRSPSTPAGSHGSTDSSGGVAVATPVAVRATVTAHKGGSPPDLEDPENGWKSSPTQVVPEYPEYTPFVTPPYASSTPTKASIFAFDSSPEGRDAHHLPDQHVPSGPIDPRDVTPWYPHAFVRCC